jgi:hypothetical protein
MTANLEGATDKNPYPTSKNQPPGSRRDNDRSAIYGGEQSTETRE